MASAAGGRGALIDKHLPSRIPVCFAALENFALAFARRMEGRSSPVVNVARLDSVARSPRGDRRGLRKAPMRYSDSSFLSWILGVEFQRGYTRQR